MNAEQTERIITRVQVKEIIRRQATIGPDETMFDGLLYTGRARPVFFPLTPSIAAGLSW